jgi:hypothetical protein
MTIQYVKQFHFRVGEGLFSAYSAHIFSCHFCLPMGIQQSTFYILRCVDGSFREFRSSSSTSRQIFSIIQFLPQSPLLSKFCENALKEASKASEQSKKKTMTNGGIPTRFARLFCNIGAAAGIRTRVVNVAG